MHSFLRQTALRAFTGFIALGISSIGIITLGVTALSVPAFADHEPGHQPIELRLLGLEDLSGLQIEQAQENTPVKLLLQIRNSESGQILRSSDLAEVHTKKFHLFAFDQALTNYIHEHPEESTDGLFEVIVNFKQSGEYKIWADLTLVTPDDHDEQHGDHGDHSQHGDHGGHGQHGSGRQLFISTSLVVAGETPSNQALTSLAPQLSGSDRGSIVSLGGAEQLEANEMSMIMLNFSRQDGARPVIRPYLGAQAHVVITDLNGSRLIHAHPVVHRGRLMLHVTFPAPGPYRLFVQYVDDTAELSDSEDLRTVELSVEVEASQHQDGL